MKTMMILMIALMTSVSTMAETPIKAETLKQCLLVNTTFDEAYEVNVYDCTTALKQEKRTMVQATVFKRFNHNTCWFKGSELTYPDKCFDKQVITKRL